jgi:hypothetical protein
VAIAIVDGEEKAKNPIVLRPGMISRANAAEWTKNYKISRMGIFDPFSRRPPAHDECMPKSP